MMKIELKPDSWVPISYKEINSNPKKDNVGNTLLLAPSDVPKALKLTIKENGDMTTIQVDFKYFSDSEPLKNIALDNKLSFSYGANSKRIYGVSLKIATVELKEKLDSLKLLKNSKKNPRSFIDKIMDELKKFGIRNFETISKIKDAVAFA